MKIALVVHDFLRGVGHGRYCIELAQRFARDHEIHVFANRFDPDLRFNFERRIVPALRATALTSVLTFPNAVEKLLKGEKFDVIHAQGFSCHRPDVITAHVCNAARYKRVPARGLLKRLFPAVVIPRERQFYRNAGSAEVIAVSKVLKNELEREYECSNVTVIYHGVDTLEFYPADASLKEKARATLGLPSTALTWLFVGEAVKGLALAIQILAEFPEARLLVVSRSPMKSYRRLAAARGVVDRVLFHGSSAAMPQIYHAADLFVYPSDYDTFGLVVAEAMASGLPVIVGKNIGAAEWIVPDENGYIFDRADRDALVARLRFIQNTPEKIIQILSARARATALEYSWDRCAEHTMETYKRAIASKRNRR